jgi:O-antigen/teichoic acid export membrane protein
VRARWQRTRSTGFTASTALAAAGVAVAGITRIVYSVFVGRAGGPELLAQATAGLALATVATMLGPAATGAAASKFLARAFAAGAGVAGVRTVWNHLLRRVLGLGTLLAVGCGFGAFVLLDVSPLGAVSLGLLVLGLSLAALTRGASFGTGRFRLTVGAELANAGVAIGLVAAGFLSGSVTSAAPSLVLLPLALGACTYAAITWPRFGPSPNDGSADRSPAGARQRDVDAFVFWGVLGNVASAGLLQLSLIVAAASDSAEGAGLYAAAVALATPAAALAQPLAQVLFPRMASADARRDEAGVRRQTDLATRGLVVLMVAVSGTVTVLAEPLLVAAYGSEFEPASQLLRVVAVAVLLSTLTVPAVTSMTSGDPAGIRTTAVISSVGLLMGATVAVIAVPAWSVVGAAAAYAAGTTTINAVFWVLVWRRQRQSWAGLTVRLLVAVAAMVVCGVVLSLLPVSGLAVDVSFVIGFVGGWLLLSRADIRELWPHLKKGRVQSPPGEDPPPTKPMEREPDADLQADDDEMRKRALPRPPPSLSS